MKKHFDYIDDSLAIYIVCIVLLLICIAVVGLVNNDRPAAKSSRAYKSTERKKELSLVNWGPLGDSDEKAERVLNAFFGD